MLNNIKNYSRYINGINLSNLTTVKKRGCIHARSFMVGEGIFFILFRIPVILNVWRMVSTLKGGLKNNDPTNSMLGIYCRSPNYLPGRRPRRELLSLRPKKTAPSFTIMLHLIELSETRGQRRESFEQRRTLLTNHLVSVCPHRAIKRKRLVKKSRRSYRCTY